MTALLVAAMTVLFSLQSLFCKLFSQKNTGSSAAITSMVFSIAYGDDFDKAKAVLKRLCDDDNRILKAPEPFIELGKLNNSSVDITVRVWVKTPDYWGVFFVMNERVYKAFAAEGLNIPFPQLDVHMK